MRNTELQLLALCGPVRMQFTFGWQKQTVPLLIPSHSPSHPLSRHLLLSGCMFGADTWP